MSEQFIALASFTHAAEAHMVLSHLEEAGVRAFLSGEMTAGVMADLRPLGPQVTLHVAASEVKRALDVVAWLRQDAPLSDEWEQDAESSDVVWKCPGCGE